MTFSIILFIISWLCFFIFADKKKLKGFLSTCYLALILGLTTDLLIHHYPLWNYPSSSESHCINRHLADDFGVYFVTTYLFLQTLPKDETRLSIARHIFFWSILAISIEFIAIKTHAMKYGLWWNMRYSYIADWILFLIFYIHHKFYNQLQSNRSIN
ncbi:hypothetical protein HNQ80_000851 [Anaerosolibacter carboniphilus]|uniref:Uncharacterized protein n=1 Tax=Anaerosolibacter carboniphilus TaxID=1417629 RepID=A0A841KMV3_9FIRM|nr:hypothetical protein [Anaerosolibacter carboniphilus]